MRLRGGDSAQAKPRLLVNAKVWTADDSCPEGDAVGISADGNILAVGTEDGVRGKMTGDIEVVDMGGKWIGPGFVDPRWLNFGPGKFWSSRGLPSCLPRHAPGNRGSHDFDDSRCNSVCGQVAGRCLRRPEEKVRRARQLGSSLDRMGRRTRIRPDFDASICCSNTS